MKKKSGRRRQRLCDPINVWDLRAAECERFALLGLGVRVVGMLAKRLKVQLGMRNKFKRYSAVPKVNTVCFYV